MIVTDPSLLEEGDNWKRSGWAQRIKAFYSRVHHGRSRPRFIGGVIYSPRQNGTFRRFALTSFFFHNHSALNYSHNLFVLGKLSDKLYGSMISSDFITGFFYDFLADGFDNKTVQWHFILHSQQNSLPVKLWRDTDIEATFKGFLRFNIILFAFGNIWVNGSNKISFQLLLSLKYTIIIA